MKASKLGTGDQFKLAKNKANGYTSGLEIGFTGIFTGRTERVDGQDMLVVIASDDHQEYLIHGGFEVELVAKAVKA